MKSINLYGSPCAGKSATAAFIFSYLKNKGINVELVTEYAKQMVYSKRQDEMANQVYMLAKQHKKMEDIASYGNVPVVVTDSPLMLGLVYSKHLDYFPELAALTCKLHNKYDNINIFVKRTKKYNPSGRNQTEEESDLLADEIFNLVDMDYTINGDADGQLDIAETLWENYFDPSLFDAKAKIEDTPKEPEIDNPIDLLTSLFKEIFKNSNIKGLPFDQWKGIFKK